MHNFISINLEYKIIYVFKLAMEFWEVEQPGGRKECLEV